MAWVFVGILAVAVCVLVSLYRRAMTEAMASNALLTLCLLDDEIAKLQREELAVTIERSPATDRHQLAKAVDAYLGGLTYKMFKETTFFGSVPELLWKTKRPTSVT